MCGIAGVVRRQHEVDQTTLEAAANALQHRGPDGVGFYRQDNVGLVHTRLSIIDLAGGAQPLHSVDQRLHLVANGEVYNYVELRQQWPLFQQQAVTHSDCESILYAYQHYGVQGFESLNGMFAFGLYDQSQQLLLLGRDRLGIKPLFYTKTADAVYFASELKALLAMLPSQPAINPLALSQFLNYQHSSEEHTIFEGVYKVAPAQCLTIDRDLTIRRRAYWQPTHIEPAALSMDEAIEAFGPLFDQVMKEHIRADVPFGLFLSGGIDSSVLLAKLTEMHPQPLKTFSIGFESQNLDDELDAAAALAKQFHTEHVSMRVDGKALFQRIVRSVWASDDLMRDYACLPTLMLSEQASQSVKVVFSGEGGDEAFAGYRRYKPSFENRAKATLFGAGGAHFRGQWQQGLGKSALQSVLRDQPSRQAYRHYWQQAPEHWSWMQSRQYLDWCTALPDNLLVKADRMMMAQGLEGRVPFSDHRLMAFGLSLPDELKYNSNKGKAIIRRWLAKKLPAAHLQKPKRGFYVPVNEWLSGSFLQALGSKLQRNAAINEWFRPEGVTALVGAQAAKGSASREVWALMQFAIWHKLFVEGVNEVPSSIEDPLDWIS